MTGNLCTVYKLSNLTNFEGRGFVTGAHGSAGRHRTGVSVSILLAAGSALAYGGSRWLLTKEREEPHSALRLSILPSVSAATVNHQPSVRKLPDC